MHKQTCSISVVSFFVYCLISEFVCVCVYEKMLLYLLVVLSLIVWILLAINTIIMYFIIMSVNQPYIASQLASLAEIML